MVTQFTGPHKVKLKKWISCAPFEELLGIKIIESKDGYTHLTMPFVFQLTQEISRDYIFVF